MTSLAQGWSLFFVVEVMVTIPMSGVGTPPNSLIHPDIPPLLHLEFHHENGVLVG